MWPSESLGVGPSPPRSMPMPLLSWMILRRMALATVALSAVALLIWMAGALLHAMMLPAPDWLKIGQPGSQPNDWRPGFGIPGFTLESQIAAQSPEMGSALPRLPAK